MAQLKHDRKLIEKFIIFYNKQHKADFILDYYPEDDKNTPPDKKIDALYKHNDLAIAIEHTSLDSYINQRKQEAEIEKVLSPLGNELKNKLPNEGLYSLVVSANYDTPKGIDWKKFRENIYNRILKESKNLALPKPGRLSILKINIDSPAFEFTLCRHNLNSNKLNGKFFISKFAHDADNLDSQKETILEKAFSQKNTKLLNYTDSNCITLLILELKDYDWDGVYRAFSNIKERYQDNKLPTKIIVINTTFPSWWCGFLKNDKHFPDWDSFIKYDEINV